jgi:hypothetical protein
MRRKGGLGVLSTPQSRRVVGVRGAGAPKKKIWSIFDGFLCPFFGMVFSHMVFVDGFLILVKELGLLTNLGQWIRGLDVHGILYVYCIVNNEYDE